MSDPPLALSRPKANPRSIPSLSSSTTSTSSTILPTPSSSFSAPKPSSVGRRKPNGLNISKSIQSSRAAPVLPADGEETKDGLTEADRLREHIQRLQLSSRSPSSNASIPESPPSSGTAPTTPTSHLAANSDGSSSSARKKSSTSIGSKGNKKNYKDKDGEDLVKDEDLDSLADLGAGNGGTVTKVWNKKRKCVMARKLILVDAKPSVRKQILRELQIMNDCNSPYIVGYYGCFPVDVHVGIVMEYMDAGSLDHIYRHNGWVPIDIVGKVAEAVLKGLMYLYDVHRIIHRDIKPSNILANTAGEIKICDFGVSGELINSIANTFVGTSTYMSPERIQGAPYTIKSDVWSLGISLIELALGRFPFSDSPDSPGSADIDADFDPDATLPHSTRRPKIKSDTKDQNKSKGVSLGGSGHTMSILDLLQHIVNEPAPTLVSRHREFPSEAVGFVEGCLSKDPATRKSPQELLASSWVVHSKVKRDDLKAWATTVA